MKNLIVFLALTSPLFFPTIVNGVNIVENTCKKISESEPNVKYNFCVKVLGSNPRSATSKLEQLAEISFNQSIIKAKSISKIIETYLKNPKFGGFQKNGLKGCKEMYASVPGEMESGLKALREKDYNSANIRVSGVITYADTCEDGFRERRLFSPLTFQNTYFMELASISLVFTNLL